MTNIAIVGKMYAGKTTLAEEFVRSHDYTRVMMAGPLKALAQLAYGRFDLPVDKGSTYSTSFGDKSGRQILQEIGQSMKAVDRDFWLKCFINDTNAMSAHGHRDVKFVVDDVRFEFEAEYLRNEGWTIIKVNTPEATRLARGERALGRPISPEELAHESEAEVDRIWYHWEWFGDTELDFYPQRVKNLLSNIENKKRLVPHG